METIREFRVETNAYTAEFGRNYGGQINVITKSGTNELRGSVYEFHRNDALDARNFFDVAEKPEFTRNQFGGVARRSAPAGPPVLLRRLRGAAREPRQDDLELRPRRQRAGWASCPTARSRSATPSGRISTPFPRANGPAVGGGLATHTFAFDQELNQDFFQGRLDYQPARAPPAVRALHLRRCGAHGCPPTTRSSRGRSSRRNQFFTGEYRNVVSDRTLQTLRFGYSRTRIGQNVEANLATRCRRSSTGRAMVGDIDIGGMQRFGPQTSADVRLSQNVYSGQYDLTQTRGRHLLKAGVLAEHYRDFMTNPTFSLGIYTFANLRTFLQNAPLRFVGLGPTGDIDRDWGWTLYGLYAQDSFQISPRLTLNGGLRYEVTTMPVDAGGRDSALVNLSDPAPTVGQLYQNPTGTNISPRTGLAWDVLGDGTTSVRAGYGLYFNTNNQQNLIVTVTNPPATPRFVIPNPTFPTPPFERGVGNTIRPVQWDLESPRLHVWNVSVQRALPADFIATIGYAGSRGTHLFRNTDVNIPTPVTGADGRLVLRGGRAAPEPQFRHDRAEEQRRRVLVPRADRRGAAEFRATASRFQSSYTWSRSEDTTQASTFFSDATNGTTVAFPEFDPGLQQGSVRLGHAAQLGRERDLGRAVRPRRVGPHGRAPRRLAAYRHRHDAERSAADRVRAEQLVAFPVVALHRTDDGSRPSRPGVRPHARETPCSAAPINGSIPRRSPCNRRARWATAGAAPSVAPTCARWISRRPSGSRSAAQRARRGAVRGVQRVQPRQLREPHPDRLRGRHRLRGRARHVRAHSIYSYLRAADAAWTAADVLIRL